jgi:hypothetical protein
VRHRCRGKIGIEGHAGLGKRGLHFRHMHRVAPDHQLIIARRDQIGGMARRMPGARHRSHTGEHFTLLEQPRPVLVGLDLLATGLKIELCRSRISLRHCAVVEPVRQFVLVHHELGVWKQQGPFDMSVSPAEWSGCMWVSYTVSIDFASIPAAARLR